MSYKGKQDKIRSYGVYQAKKSIHDSIERKGSRNEEKVGNDPK